MSKFMELELDIMGVDFTFDVEYVISSYGTPDSYYEPGDAPELYIDQVINKRTGEDMTDWLDKNHDWWNKSYKPWLSITNHIDYRSKHNIAPLVYELFHRPPNEFLTDRDSMIAIRKIGWHALTYLEVLRDKIYALEEFDEGGDKGGYD